MIRLVDEAAARRAAAAAVCTAALLAGSVACGSQAASPAPSPSAAPAASPAAGGSAGPAAPQPQAPEVIVAGDIPDNQVFVPYTAPDQSFQVSVPEGWARTADGAAVLFTDKYNSVRVESVQRPAAPDPASATSDEVPAISAGTPYFALGNVTSVTRKAGPAVLITYNAASPADPVTGKSVATAVERYEFWKGGQDVVLTLSGPQGADNVDPWRAVTDSFGWQR
jgi:hypothetical protein